MMLCLYVTFVAINVYIIVDLVKRSVLVIVSLSLSLAYRSCYVVLLFLPHLSDLCVAEAKTKISN